MITSKRAYLEAILELGQAEKRAVVLMGGTGNLCSSRNTRSQTSSRGKPKSRNCIGCWEATFVRGIYMEMGEEETKGGVVAKTFSNWTSKWLEDWDSKEHVRCSTFLILYEAEKEKKTRKEKRREKHIVEDGVEWEERNRKGRWLVIFFWSLPSTVHSIAFLSFFLSFLGFNNWGAVAPAKWISCVTPVSSPIGQKPPPFAVISATHFL